MYNAFVFLLIFISLPYLFVWGRNLIWDLYLWQVKEYRFDRLLSQLSFEKTKGVRNPLTTYFSIALFTLIFVFFLIGEIGGQLFLIVVAFFIYWYETFVFLPKLMTKKFFRPNLKSLRNLIIIFLMIGIFALPYLWLVSSIPGAKLNNESIYTDNVVSVSKVVEELTPIVKDDLNIYRPEYLILFFSTIIGIGADLFSPFFLGLLVFITRPIAYFRRKSIISKAINKLSDNPQVRVVAVTGSYGKSTTKEIIFQILSQRFDCIKTEKNNNTDVGIASTILKKLKKSTEVFVAEMGAYKVGEINDCCKVAKPNIGIVTGIDQQHLSLYGSMQAILDSSFEVVECLTPGGLAIYNGDNKHCLDLGKKTKARKQFYYASASNKNPNTSTVSASGLESTKKGLQFKLKYESKEFLVKTNLKVEYNVSNLLAAVLTALELGLDIEEIVKIVNDTEFQVPYLNLLDGQNGVKILDDGYNANFTGFIAALNHLKEYKVGGKKYVFTQGIIELGQEREKTYHTLSKHLLEDSDGIFTNDKDLYFALLDQKLQKDKLIKYIDNVFDFAIYYKTMIKKEDMLLLEGPFPKAVLDKIYLKKHNG